MAQKANFPFKEKEMKYFAPIVGTTTKKTVENGAVVSRLIPKSGVKGVYAKVRLSLPTAASNSKRELFAISTEAFISSK